MLSSSTTITTSNDNPHVMLPSLSELTLRLTPLSALIKAPIISSIPLPLAPLKQASGSEPLSSSEQEMRVHIEKAKTLAVEAIRADSLNNSKDAYNGYKGVLVVIQPILEKKSKLPKGLTNNIEKYIERYFELHLEIASDDHLAWIVPILIGLQHHGFNNVEKARGYEHRAEVKLAKSEKSISNNNNKDNGVNIAEIQRLYMVSLTYMLGHNGYCTSVGMKLEEENRTFICSLFTKVEQ